LSPAGRRKHRYGTWNNTPRRLDTEHLASVETMERDSVRMNAVAEARRARLSR
jgi:hypothetical protein